MNYDGNSFHPRAMWDDKMVYPTTESDYAFKPHVNDTFVEAFKIETFNQDCTETAILKIKHYNPPGLIFEQLAVEELVHRTEINRMKNGYIRDTLRSVDCQEIFRIGESNQEL